MPSHSYYWRCQRDGNLHSVSKSRTLWDRISPEELAGLVSKQDGDSAASTQVLSHYGDFGAPRLWAPTGGQTRDCGRLNPDAEKQRLREMISKTRQKRDSKQDTSEKRICGGCFISYPQKCILFLMAKLVAPVPETPSPVSQTHSGFASD